MASRFDLQARLDQLHAELLYTSTPPKLLEQVQANINIGHWPLVVNIKGSRPDNTLVILPLKEYERLALLDTDEGNNAG